MLLEIRNLCATTVVNCIIFFPSTHYSAYPFNAQVPKTKPESVKQIHKKPVEAKDEVRRGSERSALYVVAYEKQCISIEAIY